MKITEYPGSIPLFRKANTKTIKKGEFETELIFDSVNIIEEYTLQVQILSESADQPAGELAMRITCTPTYLPELVLGRLLTEGYIHSTDEIKELEVIGDEHLAKVILEDSGKMPSTARPSENDTAASANGTEMPLSAQPVETVSTCSVDERTIQGLLRREQEIRPIPTPERAPKLSWLWKLEDRFGEDTELHKKTHATHSCFLMREGEIIFEAEDIGRHNAIDKAVGWAVRRGISTQKCILYTSGRMPVDMVRKVIRAGIPVMVSKEAPTSAGIQMAEKYGLTLIDLNPQKVTLFFH